MKPALVLLAHPDIQKSRANQTVFNCIKSLPHLTAVDLYEENPYFSFDTKREQERLLAHEIIVFQFPIYWYSCPPLLKLWFDEVLEFNFAYGPNGVALKGKLFQLILTTGGDRHAYQNSGIHQNEFSAFLPPWRQTAELCKMVWLPPLVLHNAGRCTQDELEAHAEKARLHLASLANSALHRDRQK